MKNSFHKSSKELQQYPTDEWTLQIHAILHTNKAALLSPEGHLGHIYRNFEGST